MKKIIIKLSVACYMLTTLSACSKYLDLKPQDKFTEPMIFSDLPGASKALNGVYLQMSSNSLYGSNLTMGVVDVLAQYYNVNSQHNLTRFQTYEYTHTAVLNSMESIWSSAYVSIVNLNQFVRNLETYPNIMPARIDSILKGEAVGLRAMLHFDMLRLFGPMCSTADSVKPSIPYYRTPSTSVAELLPANQVLDSIINDLKYAESLLSNDPIITGGLNTGEAGDGYDFFRSRNQRMNFFAIKGLQARVYLYRRDFVSALAAAKYVIDNSETYFPWITTGAILSDKINPNRVFSTELLFAGFNSNMYTNYNSIFSSDLQDNAILAPNDTRLKAFFESNESDYRYNPMWIVPSTNKSYKTFYKYADVVDKAKNYRYLFSLIRKSEMYYIAAECETNTNTAIDYLNVVRFNRGLGNLPYTVNKITELQKEYQKEFFGEGQLFFFYKRRVVTSIPNPTAASGNITMLSSTVPNKYLMPLPLSETLYR